jgi:hypothetical protein
VFLLECGGSPPLSHWKSPPPKHGPQPLPLREDGWRVAYSLHFAKGGRFFPRPSSLPGSLSIDTTQTRRVFSS